MDEQTVIPIYRKITLFAGLVLLGLDKKLNLDCCFQKIWPWQTLNKRLKQRNTVHWSQLPLFL